METISELPRGEHELRLAVREWLTDQRAAGAFVPHCDAWLTGFDVSFSRRLGELGLIGMTWPAKYGGGDRSPLERFVATEEILRAGAPAAAQWVNDRQLGPTLLKYGTDAQKDEFIPKLITLEAIFALGMSEPDSGSDLASIRTAAAAVEGGFLVNGTKVWSSHAHEATHADVLVRTERGEVKHEGMSELIIDLTSPGVTVRPITHMSGGQHFNEMIFEDVFVPDDMVVGEVGRGWQQITAQLSLERSGPERFLSTWPLFEALVDRLSKADATANVAIGEFAARYATLHKLSYGVAAALVRGESPIREAALVKDIGTRLEFEVIELARSLVDVNDRGDDFERLLKEATFAAPGASLRGGTNEILRGIVARRSLGVK